MGTEGLVAGRDGSCLHRNRNHSAGHLFWQEKEVESTGEAAGDSWRYPPGYHGGELIAGRGPPFLLWSGKTTGAASPQVNTI